MKFLVLGKPKDTLSMLPPATAKQILEVSMAAMKQQKKAGTLLESYITPSSCPVVILDYKNIQDWIKDQNAMPILTYYNYEIYPLGDMEESVKSYLEALEMAERMMPGASG